MGIVVAALLKEPSPLELPEHLKPYWDNGMGSFHGPDRWRGHWEKTGLVTVEVADMLPEGWSHWIASDEVLAEWQGERSDESEA